MTGNSILDAIGEAAARIIRLEAENGDLQTLNQSLLERIKEHQRKDMEQQRSIAELENDLKAAKDAAADERAELRFFNS